MRVLLIGHECVLPCLLECLLKHSPTHPVEYNIERTVHQKREGSQVTQEVCQVLEIQHIVHNGFN